MNKDEIVALLNKSDYQFYQELIEKDSFGKTFSKEQQNDIINKSILAAESIYQEVLNKYGVQQVVTYLRLNGIKIVYSHVDGPRLYIAIYDSRSKEIDLNLTAIDYIKKKIKNEDCEDILDKDKVVEVAYMHEFYHHLEMTLDNVYTYQKSWNSKILGIFKTKKRCAIASEIGAIHFSKLATSLPYSPIVYGKIITK